MSKDGQGTKRRRQICETFNRLSTAHKRYRYRQTTDRQTTDGRQMTDGRVTAYSEREREFTLAKTWKRHLFSQMLYCCFRLYRIL